MQSGYQRVASAFIAGGDTKPSYLRFAKPISASHADGLGLTAVNFRSSAYSSAKVQSQRSFEFAHAVAKRKDCVLERRTIESGYYNMAPPAEEGILDGFHDIQSFST